jgi:hypothetical protein
VPGSGTAVSEPLVDSYVFGSVLRASESRRSAGAAREDPEAVGAIVEYGLAQLRTGDYPHTAALLGDRDPRDADAPAPPMDERGLAEQFERGLQAVLDGAAARFVKDGGRSSPQ